MAPATPQQNPTIEKLMREVETYHPRDLWYLGIVLLFFIIHAWRNHSWDATLDSPLLPLILALQITADWRAKRRWRGLIELLKHERKLPHEPRA